MADIVAVSEAFEPDLAGYLAAQPGDELQVLYEGWEGEEADWLYVRATKLDRGCNTLPQGWFPKALVRKELRASEEGVQDITGAVEYLQMSVPLVVLGPHEVVGDMVVTNGAALGNSLEDNHAEVKGADLT